MTLKQYTMDVYLALAAAIEEGVPRVSHAPIAERSGFSNRIVQEAVRHLVERDLLRVTRRGAIEIPRYETLTPWRRRRSPKL